MREFLADFVCRLQNPYLYGARLNLPIYKKHKSWSNLKIKPDFTGKIAKFYKKKI